MARFFVAVIETQSNQPYIFTTNRQAAALGASQLLWESCINWVEDCVEPPVDANDFDTKLDAFVGPGDDQRTLLVLATSGRAVLMSRSRESLCNVVGQVTARALRDAPGLGIAGGVSEYGFEWEEAQAEVAGFWRTMQGAQERLRRNWSATRKPTERLPRLPLVRDCALSSLPASRSVRVPDGSEDRSEVVHSQITARDRATARIERDLGETGLARSVDEISGKWHAVFHADSNGFGSLFGGMGSVLPTDNRGCVIRYREISDALATAANESALAAIERVAQRDGAGKDPVWFPIVFGGDDVTVVTAGHVAMTFATTYLTEYAEKTTRALRAWVEKLDPSRAQGLPATLTASGGLVFAKPKFPFHAAYDIAEELINSAKSRYRPTEGGSPKEASSMLDLHVLYESSDTSLDSIRARRHSDDKAKRHGGPYTVGLEGEGDLSQVTKIVDCAMSRSSQDDGGPSSLALLRDLREAFTKSTAQGVDRLKGLRALYPNVELLTDLEQSGDRLGETIADIVDLVVVTQPATGIDS